MYHRYPIFDPRASCKNILRARDLFSELPWPPAILAMQIYPNSPSLLMRGRENCLECLGVARGSHDQVG